MSEKAYSLKDDLFNVEKVHYLAGLFAEQDADFDGKGFERVVMARMLSLELKARIHWIAEVLEQFLPGDFEAAAARILAALPMPLDPEKSDDDFGDFIFAPLGEYVVNQGIESQRERSFELLEALTQRFSMEFAIRPFLNRWPDQTLERMSDWVAHPSYHVRRLVSEGSRPKLPWGMKIHSDPLQALPFLDALHADPTRYVTRSVANHLNDIAKSEPDVVVERLGVWAGTQAQEARELDWITRHALRGLVKAGDAGALRLLGFDPDADVTVRNLTLSPDPVMIGDTPEISFDIICKSTTRLIVDYVIEFPTPGGRIRRKVFKLAQVGAEAGQSRNLRKSHRFKGGASTFTLHAGRHRLLVQINGRVCAEAGFDLRAPGAQ